MADKLNKLIFLVFLISIIFSVPSFAFWENSNSLISVNFTSIANNFTLSQVFDYITVNNIHVVNNATIDNTLVTEQGVVNNLLTSSNVSISNNFNLSVTHAPFSGTGPTIWSLYAKDTNGEAFGGINVTLIGGTGNTPGMRYVFYGGEGRTGSLSPFSVRNFTTTGDAAKPVFQAVPHNCIGDQFFADGRPGGCIITKNILPVDPTYDFTNQRGYDIGSIVQGQLIFRDLYLGRNVVLTSHSNITIQNRKFNISVQGIFNKQDLVPSFIYESIYPQKSGNELGNATYPWELINGITINSTTMNTSQISSDNYYGDGSKLDSVPNIFDQDLNTTDDVEFVSVNTTNGANFSNSFIGTGGNIQNVQINNIYETSGLEIGSPPTTKALEIESIMTGGVGDLILNPVWRGLFINMSVVGDPSSLSFGTPTVNGFLLDVSRDEAAGVGTGSDGNGWLRVISSTFASGTYSDTGIGALIQGNTSATIFGASTIARNQFNDTTGADPGEAVGYRGFASGTVGNSELISIDAVSESNAETGRITGVRSLVVAQGTLPIKSKIMSWVSNNGHMIVNNANTWIMENQRVDLTTNPSSFIGNTTEGSLYVENHIDSDGNFTGNMVYGEMYNHSDVGWAVTISDSTNYFNVTQLEPGLLNGFEFDSSTSTLTAQVQGVYKMNWHMGFEQGVPGSSEYQLAPKQNETSIINKCETHRKVTSQDVGSASGTCLVKLDTGDTIRMGMQNVDNTNNPNVFTFNLNLERIGDW